MKKLLAPLVLALVSLILPPGSAHADGGLVASVSVPNVTYRGTTGCLDVPVTLSVSGGSSNGFNYWTTENESLAGPTSFPTPATFFFDNEQAPGTDTMTMCPWADHAGVYTYSADVRFHSSSGGDQYAGRVSVAFSVSDASSSLGKIGTHKWKVSVVGQPYLVSYPTVYLQKRKGGGWRTISHGQGNSAGVFALKKRAPAKYRLLYKGNSDIGLAGSTSKVFRKP